MKSTRIECGTGASRISRMATALGTVLLLGASARPAWAVATLAVSKTTVVSGESMTVTFSGVSPSTTLDWIGLYPSAGPHGTGNPAIKWAYTSNCDQTTDWKTFPENAVPGNKKKASGVCSVVISGAQGTYNFRLFANDGYTLLATSPTVTITSSSPAEVTVSSTAVAAGAGIVVSWTGSTSATDWISLQVPDADHIPNIDWFYTNSCTRTAGAMPASSGSCSFTMPMVARIYEFRYYANNGYTVLDLSPQVNVGAVSSAPAFSVDPFSMRHAVVGTAYSGKIAVYARDPNGKSTITYSKVSGPSWLSVAADGTLSGTPAIPNLGANAFVVRVTDSTAQADDAAMNISVFASGAESVTQLKILAFNTWEGGTRVNNGSNKSLDAIIKSGADVVSISENYATRATEYASALGWYGHNGSNGVGILSRYPITATYAAGNVNGSNDFGHGAKVRLTSSPLKEAILWSAHLDYLHYGPYEACFSPNTNVTQIVNEENLSWRPEQMQSILSAMSGQLANANNIPAFLVGDFNTPSHLDWVSGASSQNCGFAVPWPVSTQVANVGMTDSFRSLNPDPNAVTGDSWSPVMKTNVNGQPEPQDRIDFIHFKSSRLTLTDSQVFTTTVENIYSSGLSVNNTWPSDHAAFVSTFTVQ
jgi:hypothetical protein